MFEIHRFPHEDDMIPQPVHPSVFHGRWDGVLHVHSHLALDDIWAAPVPPGTIQPDLNDHSIVFRNSARPAKMNSMSGEGET